jgi:hypothetical protein
MQGRRFGFIGIIATLVIAAVAGVIGYNLGLGAGLDAGTGATGPVVYAPWGFGGFGILLFILLVILVIGAFRRAAWGGYHHYGPRGWGEHAGRDLPPMADSMLQEWHRRAHSEASPPTGSSATPAGTTL